MARIRDAEPNDAGELESLQRRASDVWEDYREQLAAHPDAIEVPRDAIRERRVRVAVDDRDRRQGFSVVLATRDGACELDGLFVDPQHMGRGLGRLLLADVVERARAAGAGRIEVTAGPAVGFYERAGFRRGAATPTRFGPALRMTLDL